MGVYAQTAENFPRRQRVLWLWVKSLVPPGKPPGQYEVVIRTPGTNTTSEPSSFTATSSTTRTRA